MALNDGLISIPDFSGIDMRDAESEYDSVKQRFKEVKGRYKGFFGRLNSRIAERDIKTIEHCFDILHSLSNAPIVIQEAAARKLEPVENHVPLQTKVFNLEAIMTAYSSAYRHAGYSILA